MSFVWTLIKGINLKTILILLLVAGGLYVVHLSNKLDNTQLVLANAKNNITAYEKGMQVWEDRYKQEHAKTIIFNENLTNFKASGDSITNKLVDIINDQNIDIKKLKQASYISTKIQTSLVKEINTKLPDTVVDLSNEHIKNLIKLSPYRIQSDIEIYNTQTAFFTDSTIKEFKPYRYKFFIKRWFQPREKHTVVNVEVINSNPLMKTQIQKFIHIVK